MTSSQFNKAFEGKFEDTFLNRPSFSINQLSTFMNCKRRTKADDEYFSLLLVNALDGLMTGRINSEYLFVEFKTPIRNQDAFMSSLFLINTAFANYNKETLSPISPMDWVMEIVRSGKLEYTGR